MEPGRTMPERVTILTCIGCGAMQIPGECGGGSCSGERRLDLVPADEFDELQADTERRAAGIEVLSECLRNCPATAEALTSRQARERSRTALRDQRTASGTPRGVDTNEPSIVTAWWCPRCGGIDAPQECIDVCIRKPVEWVNATAYAQLRERAQSLVDQESEMLAAVRALAFVTPKLGQEHKTLAALQRVARCALENSAA